VTIEGIATDSRTARPGDLFVALRGERFDGHDFLARAAGAGCILAIVDRKAAVDESVLSSFGGGVIGVDDTTAALGDVAAHCRRHMSASVVAVTGSNGKTTVKRMIHHILSRRLRGTMSPKSFNNAVGVPLTLFAVAANDEYVVCEVGSNAPGEIASLARVARPDVAVIASVAPTHLEGLGDLEHVAKEKAALLVGLPASGLGVIWADSEPLGRAVRGYDARLIRFGADEAADLRVTDYRPRPDGGRFRLNGRLWVELPVPGRHNAVNALAAIAVAQRFGFSQDEAAAALADYRGAEMRLERVDAGAVTVINDAYNANPASLAAAAEALAAYDARRRVAVVGDMLELGPRAGELHRAAGAHLAGQDIALVVGVGELAAGIADAAGEAGAGAVKLPDVDAAAEALPGLLRDGDVVLLKGSRAMRMERLVGPIREAFADGRAAGAPTAPPDEGKRPTC